MTNKEKAKDLKNKILSLAAPSMNPDRYTELKELLEELENNLD